ncbi:hypothetical protein SDC9_125328 [bioreactor metagenome]|uniref:Uncharacterized protein n=1 Tax=bioreactor metagenome TaxID=1076179 RepID=A0A645CN22_9ZZZZ
MCILPDRQCVVDIRHVFHAVGERVADGAEQRDQCQNAQKKIPAAAVEARIASPADIDDAHGNQDDRQGIGDYADHAEQRFSEHFAKVTRGGKEKIGRRENATGDQQYADSFGSYFVAPRSVISCCRGFFSAGCFIACFGSQRCFQSFLFLEIVLFV